MVDIMNEAEAAEQMMSDLKATQEKKAAKQAQQAEEVSEALAHAKEVAVDVAAGKVVSAKTSEPVAIDPSFDPEEEAAASARMIDSLLEKQAARAARHDEQVEAYGEDVFEQASAAHKVSDSVKETLGHLKEKFSR